MELDILQSILNKIEININENIAKEVVDFIYKKKENTYIYPEVLADKFKLDIRDAFKICTLFEKKSILKRVYKLYCPKCQEFDDEIFENFNEIEEYGCCEWCGKNLIDEQNPYKYIFIYFKKLSER